MEEENEENDLGVFEKRSMLKIKETYDNLSSPVKATIWFMLCNVLQKGIMFLGVPIYTRIMSTEQYGLYCVALSWLELFEILATFRLGWGGYVVGLTKFKEDRAGYTSSMQCLSITITLVFLIIYLLFSTWINNLTGLNTEMTLILLGTILFMPVIRFWSVGKRVEYKYIDFLILTVFSSIFTLVGGVFFAIVFDNKVKAVLVARLLVQSIQGIVLLWCNCKDKFVLYHNLYWKRALKFNVPLLPYYLSMVILNSSDKIMIKQLVGTAEAGIYGVAYTISMCMQIFSSALNQTLQPWLYDKMKKDDNSQISSVINNTLILVASVNVILIAFAPEVLYFIASEEYQGAKWIIPPLAVSVVVMYFYQPFVNIEFYYEESKLTALASVGAAVVNIGLNLICIPNFGYLAAGYTTLVSYLVFAAVHYLFMKKVCRKNTFDVEEIININFMIGIIIFLLIITVMLVVSYSFLLARCAIIMILCIIMYGKKKQIKNIVCVLMKSE